MKKPPNPCQEPFTACWCESRPNNTHCADAVPIDNNYLSITIVALILIYGGFKIIK